VSCNSRAHCILTEGQPARRVIFDDAAAGRHLLDIARQAIHVIAATATGVLLDVVAFVVQVYLLEWE
jgi:hypothetical protein